MSGKRALGILTDATIGHNSQKFLKLNIPDFPFLEQNELLKYLGELETLVQIVRFHQLVQDSFGFSFSELFVHDIN